MGISGQGCGYVCGMAFGVRILKETFGNFLSFICMFVASLNCIEVVKATDRKSVV